MLKAAATAAGAAATATATRPTPSTTRTSTRSKSAHHEQAAAIYNVEMPANVALQEWKTVDVEDLGGSYARMVNEEPKAGPFACFVDALNFLD